MIRLCIVDDKRIMRIGISEKFSGRSDIQVLFMAENGKIFLDEMKARKKNDLPEIVLMDIDMPEMNGIDTIRIAKELYPSVEFIILTVFDEDEKIFDAIKAGATGYLLKDEHTAHLVQAILDVHEYKSVPLSPVIARKALSLFAQATNSIKDGTSLLSPLSDRETDILRGLVDGLDYKLIAEKIFLSPFTVRNHITNIYRKMHVNSKVDAVKLAIKNNWV